MPDIATPACTGAVSLKSGGFETQHNRTTDELQFQPCADERTRCLAGPRYEHLCRQVHALGPRPLAEMLIEIATATGQPDLIANRLQAYAQLDPEIVRAVGADRFPPAPLGLVR